MTDVLAGLDWLAETFDTWNLRIAVSVASIGLLLFVLLSYRQLQTWLTDRVRPLHSDIVSTAILTGTCLFTGAAVLGVWGGADLIRSNYQRFDGGGDVIGKAVVSFILVIATIIVTRFVRRVLEEVLSSAATVTAHQREITHRLTQVIIWSVALVVILGVWVDDLGGLLVGAGFLGIVVGMAARQTLGTMLAGFVLMFARPFEIGDWIEVEDNEGIVTDISIVNTRIRSFDGEYIMIPNDVISSSMVTNRSRRGRLRIEVEVGVDYGSDVERAADLATDVIDDLDQALAAPSPQVVTKSFGDSAVLLGVRFWIDKPSARRRWQARTAAINGIKRAFEDEGIKIPYPQRELSGRAETGGFRIADERRTATSDRNDDDGDGADRDREQQLTASEDR